jgi:hypothetical protein
LQKQAPQRPIKATSKKKKEATEKVEIIINMENNDSYNRPLTEEELENALHECNGTSPGLDDIHYEFLKRMDTKER